MDWMYCRLKEIEFEFKEGKVEVFNGEDYLSTKEIGWHTDSEAFVKWCNYFVETEEFLRLKEISKEESIEYEEMEWDFLKPLDFCHIDGTTFIFDEGSVIVTRDDDILCSRYIGRDSSNDDFKDWCFYFKEEEIQKYIS